MAEITNALFRIDPTQGLVDYVNAVKPYHSKVLDVLVEYVYTEPLRVTVGESWKWNMHFTRPNSEVVYSCGYGYRWDGSGVVSPESIPVSLIVKATGKLFIDITTNAGSNTINIIRNTTGHSLSVNDPVVFDTDATLPTVITAGHTYYVTSITPTTMSIAATVGGTPIIMGGVLVLRIAPQGLQYNTFLVKPSLNSSSYKSIATSTASNQLSFVDSYLITGVDYTANTWTFAPGLGAPTLAANDIIYINGNSSFTANGKYTVDSVIGYVIYVKEDIPPLTTGTGTMYVPDKFDTIPYWPVGAKVRVSSTGALPTPLSATLDYYFIPSTTVGVFNLTNTRYPLNYDDYINLSTIGDEFTITRVEPFSPGDTVNVAGSYLHHNDGQYYISTVEADGVNFRIGVLQSVKSTTPTPAPAANDGSMTFNAGSYDMPTHCPAVQTPDLYAGAFIHENLQFTFSISERDFIGTTTVENEFGGWGLDLFGSTASLYGGGPKLQPYTVMTDGVSTSSITHTLVPTGFDTQFFDFGPMDEDLRGTRHLQELP